MAEINQYRQELRNKIIDYAMAEFYKRGVKAVKMDEISRGLHVSKRTVYEIFGDKEELLLAGMKMQQAKELQELEEFANTQARNVIDIISYVYKLQMRRWELFSMRRSIRFPVLWNSCASIILRSVRREASFLLQV